MNKSTWWEELMLDMLKRVDPYIDHLLLSALIPNEEKIAMLNDEETSADDTTAALLERLDTLDTEHKGFEAMTYLARCLLQILVSVGYSAVEVMDLIRSQLYTLIAELEARELETE